MHRIIVADIFGLTVALDEFAAGFSQKIEIFDPYNAKIMGFKSEAEAYAYFSSEVGLDNYAADLLKKLSALAGEVSLIGFSVGASAIWKIASHNELSKVSGAKCFYGSQIRHYTGIDPVFPIQLIFPSSEQHFSVSDLISDLSGKENVQIQQVVFLHGFMNHYSQNFNSLAYTQFTNALYKVPFNQPIKADAFYILKSGEI